MKLPAFSEAQQSDGDSAGLGLQVGVPVAVLLLLGCESGLPVPVPADLIMLAIGAAVSAGTLPWWVAVVLLEAVAVVGTTALLVAARGPGAAVLDRLGRRVGLTPTRMARVSGWIERRGVVALAVGRAVPGLRTVTVITAGSVGVPYRRALPALLAGSTVFLQGHLLLGLALGEALGNVIRAVLGSWSGRLVLPALAAAVAVFALAVRRRRRRWAGTTPQGWSEGICPACLAVRAALGHEGEGGQEPSR
jgi:membrane protein DedA with SNARE-associated domain